MAWYKAQAILTLEVEADNEEEARARLKTLMEKRVVEQTWGETAKVRPDFELSTPERDDEDPYACQHCGLPGGH